MLSEEKQWYQFYNTTAPQGAVDKLVDYIYVINMDKDVSRYIKVNNSLNDARIDFVRFAATDGTRIKIEDILSKKSFSGDDIKKGNYFIENQVTYKVTCDHTDNPVTFDLKGYLSNSGKKASAGEIGLWCSNKRIWKDAKNHSYSKIVIFEDDIIAKPTLKKDLYNFISNLPQDTDMAYIDYRLKTPNELIQVNEFVDKFTNQASGYATWAMVITKKGIDKLESLTQYTLSLDKFYWCYSTGKVNYKHYSNNNCKEHENFFTIYASSKRMLSISGGESSISLMGREDIDPKKYLYIPKIIHRIWFSWDKSNPTIPTKYIEYDTTLKKIHHDWQIMEWNEQSVETFIKLEYPDEIWQTYSSYDLPIKQHDAARYLIINHFGGVFIQHSIQLQKNLSPLLYDAEVIFSYQRSKKDNSLHNGFFASVPNHKIWQNIIEQLSSNAHKYVTLATGPKFLGAQVNKYLQTEDISVKILPHQHLFPFDWEQAKTNSSIKENCIKNDHRCFELFPEAFGFCAGSGGWLKLYEDNEL